MKKHGQNIHGSHLLPSSLCQPNQPYVGMLRFVSSRMRNESARGRCSSKVDVYIVGVCASDRSGWVSIARSAKTTWVFFESGNKQTRCEMMMNTMIALSVIFT